jgi:tRNA(His) 5'-end guanylyltransferase
MTLGDRMKAREASAGELLPPRMPAVLRVDGRAFHTLTRGFDKPFDSTIEGCMERVAVALCREISAARLAYGQSDEVSVLLVDYASLATEQWFGGRRRKMETVAASIATAAFGEALHEAAAELEASSEDEIGRIQLIRSRIFRSHFDARILPVPEDDVCNYFLWRQRDAIRNSVLAAGQSALPRRQMHGMKCADIRAALIGLGQPWEGLAVRRRRGFSVARSPATAEEAAWSIDSEPPDFGENRDYIERWLAPEANFRKDIEDA